MGIADEVLRTAARDRRLLWLETATVSEVLSDGTLALNLSGGTVIVPTVSRAALGDLVRVLRSEDGAAVSIGGPVLPLGPAVATVSAFVAGASLSVTDVNGTVFAGLPYLTSYAPAIGDAVAIDWSRAGLVQGRISSAGIPAGLAVTPETPVVVVPPAPLKPTSGTEYFSADASGSHNGGSWWTDKVYYSQSNKGIWVYGTKVGDTLRGATALDGCKIFLPVERATGSNAHLGVHPHARIPAGAPAVSAGRAVSVTVDHSAWYPLPTDIAQYLIDNPGAGVSTYGAGYRIFTGRSGNRDSGRLAINYRR